MSTATEPQRRINFRNEVTKARNKLREIEKVYFSQDEKLFRLSLELYDKCDKELILIESILTECDTHYGEEFCVGSDNTNKQCILNSKIKKISKGFIVIDNYLLEMVLTYYKSVVGGDKGKIVYAKEIIEILQDTKNKNTNKNINKNTNKGTN